jgi:hypothetical protein
MVNSWHLSHFPWTTAFTCTFATSILRSYNFNGMIKWYDISCATLYIHTHTYIHTHIYIYVLGPSVRTHIVTLFGFPWQGRTLRPCHSTRVTYWCQCVTCCVSSLRLFAIQDRQCKCKSNIEALSRDHCCSVKEISVSYSVCVCVWGGGVLRYPACNAQAAYYLLPLLLCHVFFLTSHERHDFRK